MHHGTHRYEPAPSLPDLGFDCRTFRPRGWWLAAGGGDPIVFEQLLIGDDGVERVSNTNHSESLRFADCVALLREDGGARTLVSRDGRHLRIDPSKWWRGDTAVRLLEAGIPAERHVPLGATLAGTLRRLAPPA